MATLEYEIRSKDNSKQGVESAKSGLKALEDGMRNVNKVMNILMGAGAIGGVVRALQGLYKAGADCEAAFLKLNPQMANSEGSAKNFGAAVDGLKARVGGFIATGLEPFRKAFIDLIDPTVIATAKLKEFEAQFESIIQKYGTEAQKRALQTKKIEEDQKAALASYNKAVSEQNNLLKRRYDITERLKSLEGTLSSAKMAGGSVYMDVLSAMEAAKKELSQVEAALLIADRNVKTTSESLDTASKALSDAQKNQTTPAGKGTTVSIAPKDKTALEKWADAQKEYADALKALEAQYRDGVVKTEDFNNQFLRLLQAVVDKGYGLGFDVGEKGMSGLVAVLRMMLGAKGAVGGTPLVGFEEGSWEEPAQEIAEALEEPFVDMAEDFADLTNSNRLMASSSAEEVALSKKNLEALEALKYNSDPATWLEPLTSKWSGGITGGMFSGAAGTGEGEFGGLGIFVSALAGFASQIASVSMLLDPMRVILQALFDTIGPVLNDVLAPIIGIFTILGQTLGAILVPVIRILSPIIEAVASAFAWFYNKVILPVGNFIIAIFNAIAKALAWLGFRTVQTERLREISLGDLYSTGANAISNYGGGYGSNSSTSRAPDIYITINHGTGNMFVNYDQFIADVKRELKYQNGLVFAA